MAANSRYIKLTLRLTNEQYKGFHAIVESGGGCKTKVLRLLVEKYIAESRGPKKRLG